MEVKITVPDTRADQRLDVVLAAGSISRAQVQKAIKRGHCRVNGIAVTSPAFRVQAHQLLELSLDTEPSGLEATGEPLPILYADEDVAVVAKPPGLTVHPCPSCGDITLVHRLLGQFPKLAAQGGERPGIVHRLDKDTSGVMVVALNEEARLALVASFAQRKVKKQYLALVAGTPQDSGVVSHPIGRHPSQKIRMAVVPTNHGGRAAESLWRKLWQGSQCALVAVTIGTGRTHQIRVHLSHVGWPILGDDLYAPRSVGAMAPRQMLHAWRLEFLHPRTRERMAFCTPPPDDFLACAVKYGESMVPLVVTGNAGSGKSAFCEELAALGVPVVSADKLVARMYSGPGEATAWMAAHLGEEVLTPAGAVDKAALFALLQAQPGMRVELERVVHGLVGEAIEQFWRENEHSPCACAEIPLFFESSLAHSLLPRPYVVGISCKDDIRAQRLAVDRGWNQEKIATMDAWQMPEEEKMARCDWVVRNDGSRQALAEQAKKLVEEITVMRPERQAEAFKTMCGCASHVK